MTTIKKLSLLTIGLICLVACDDNDKYVTPFPEPMEPDLEMAAIYVYCEGSYSASNSTIAYYDFDENTWDKDFFFTQNQRGLGASANDFQQYGSKLYCVVTSSNTLEVIDARTGTSIKKISFVNEHGVGRQPRYITFHKEKAYVCSFDNTVARIDTTSMEIEAYAICGRNPDGICVANNKLYVSNSGGLDFPNYDRTVSVIDIARFEEIKQIEVYPNPYKIAADSEGDVYVVSRRDYEDESVWQRIDSRTDQVVDTIKNMAPLNFTIHKDTAYLYSYDFNTGNSAFYVFDCKTETIIQDQFITDGTEINAPYGINVSPVTGDVYITDARDYVTSGDLYCFDRNGKLKLRVESIGLNPNTTVFVLRDKEKSLN